MIPEPGIYYDVAFTEYQGWQAYNPSLIKLLLSDSPMALRHVREAGSETTDEMDLGRAVHMAVLQSELFERCYCVFEGARRAGKAWDQFCDENQDKEILTALQFGRCIRMRDAVRAHRAAHELISGDGRCEASLVWEDSATGALCKGRVDFLTDTRIVDLKTARDPQPFKFQSQAAQLLYHVSMGAYMDGLWSLGRQTESAHFIAIGNKPWHDVIRYDIAPQVIRKGIELWQFGLSRAVECERMGKWPGFSAEPIEFLLPEWAQEPMSPQPVTVGGESVFDEEA